MIGPVHRPVRIARLRVPPPVLVAPEDRRIRPHHAQLHRRCAPSPVLHFQTHFRGARQFLRHHHPDFVVLHRYHFRRHPVQ